MNKLFTLLFILAFTIINAQSLKENSVGVVRLDGIEGENLYLKIYFPINRLDSIPKILKEDPYSIFSENSEYKIPFTNSIILADENSKIYELNNLQYIRIAPWCENDGGISFMLEISTEVNKNNFKYNYSKEELLEDFICFAAYNLKLTNGKEAKFVNEVECLKKVDFNNDGFIDAYIYGEPDEAMGGLCLFLGYGDYKSIDIDCCGP